jgi:hypothetical protein
MALSLTLQPKTSVAQIGDSVEVRFVLENGSSQELVGCLTDRNGYTWRGQTSLKQMLSAVDHNYCQRPFVLGPGQKRTWTEEIGVLDVGLGDAKLQAWVQVVDQCSCDRHGCDGRYIYSNQVPISVVLF